MKLLEVHGLAKKYGSRQVVNDVSFDVDAGEIVGLLGPNGAGKTTSFRMTCGMVTPDQGRVLLDGRDVTKWPMHQRAKEGGLGYLPQQSSVFGKLTVEQNLTATMQLLGFTRKRRLEETEQLLSEFGLVSIRHTISAQVSGGERRRLEIARCLISQPRMIMLDEPFAGIDPVTVQGIQVIIQHLSKRGLGILITDHAAREILQITQRTYVIHQGKVMCSGSPLEVARHPDVREKYLGAIESFAPLESTPSIQTQTFQFRDPAPLAEDVGARRVETFKFDAPAGVVSEHSVQPADSRLPTSLDSPITGAESSGERQLPPATQLPPGTQRRAFPQPRTIRNG